jgi:transcriptional regulator with XRE-family HTH domain
MLLNDRMRRIRIHRKLTSTELAHLAGLSLAEISLLEKKMRMPKIDTLQRLAAALEVTSSFLLGEEDSDLAIPAALAKQSLKLFLRDTQVANSDTEYLERVCKLDSAPQTKRGWSDLLSNVSAR